MPTADCLGVRQESLGFTPWQVGIFSSAMAVGPVLAPFIVGQLVDRWFATEKVMAVCHIVGGVLMLLLGDADARVAGHRAGNGLLDPVRADDDAQQLAGVSASEEQRHGVPVDSAVRHAGLHRAGLRDRVLVAAGTGGRRRWIARGRLRSCCPGVVGIGMGVVLPDVCRIRRRAGRSRTMPPAW